MSSPSVASAAKTAKYCDIELNDYQKSLKGDADAVYVRTLTYRAEDFVPVMACPSQVDKIRDVSTLEGTPIDQVFIGSCTNSRIEDLRAAAAVVKGKKRAPNVALAMVVPGSGLVKEQAEKEGLDKIFIEAGFEWREPGCSMCLAMNDDRLAPGERCASTSNRNFEGRQGQGGRTHLVSPAMAAAAGIAGHFVDVRENR